MISKTDPPHRRIGLLGGSFNPAHAGHREISLAAMEKLGLDAVWWLVTPGNPLKDPGIYAEYAARLAGAREAANHPDIVVSDFEQRRGLQYTVDTLRQVKDTNPNADFVWIMGADSLSQFHRWKDWRDIAELAPFAVFARPGYEDALSSPAGEALKDVRLPAERAGALSGAETPAWIYFAETANPISSTALRAAGSPAQDTGADLSAPHGPLAFFLDLHPAPNDFHADAMEGLAAKEKCLSPKYFYDERGSRLFQKITEQPEYYPTRTEKEIFTNNAPAICAAPGANVAIFEYGSGASEKIEWLLTGLERPAAYVAMDISRDYLIGCASAIAERFEMPVAAVCADFHGHVEIPKGILPEPDRWFGYFPGSTIGNMTPPLAARFLRRAGETLGLEAKLLLGVDLVKDVEVLNAAYNDAAGVTAAFNLNVLRRMQRELGADLAIDDFEHDAFYNERESRIEMHLRARRETSISLDGRAFRFAAGESLHTENSYKYTIERLEALFAETPWRLETVWTDPKKWFAACLLSRT
ncbi:MAG: L-histidine N(alpha)-methyltransferase [Pseudomonadota bacterium]